MRRGLLLNYLTIAYNTTEAVVALAAGLVAGSVALIGFGVDSAIEVTASLAAVAGGSHADVTMRLPLGHRPGWRGAEYAARLVVAGLVGAIEHGAVNRLRPKLMTVAAIMLGLLPALWSHGTGAEVMKRIAAPMVGGMVTSTILTLIVIPALYYLWRRREIEETTRERGPTL